ncbi:drug/metabolite transporter (DMT)-like permease [Rubricella aquisinus]|uniref:Drug/metabolite transporter (DMT)-like permease n=1 Tax=Rubricella aquisinus TaxID=2028108 RepID=A0A840WIM4_9RHOB|nr:DMT family transporter [Rubricella aquisinus]MBB5514959.1 drug/metabolite transporter (DMT)-like permease [Rubricella aquisinus]
MTEKRQAILAWGAVALTLTIWASYLVVTRAAVLTELNAVDIGLLRFIPAAILFAPIWLRTGLLPKGTHPREIVSVALLGGFGFVLLLSIGMVYAPVADSVIFAPSMLPLYVGILSFFLLGERFGRGRVIGFALILIGAVGVGGYEAILNSGSGTWRGHLFFTVAAFVWAVFTLNFRCSALGPFEGAAMLCLWSALAFGVLALFVPVTLFDAAPRVLVVQILMQGVLSGYVSTLSYAYALRHLAPSRVAACAALVPVMGAIGGIVFLGETVPAIKWVGIGIVAMGVALASGVFEKKGRKT